MNSRRYFALFTVALLGLSALSCKDDDDETKLYLSGSVSIVSDMPAYVQVGDKYEFTATGVTTDDSDVTVSYYFTDPFTSVRDTILSADHTAESVCYTIPDTLGTFSVSCVAFASNSSDYYTTSTSKSFVVVNPVLNDGTLTNFPIFEDEESVMIHGVENYIANVGMDTWLRRNIEYVDGSFGCSYFQSEAMLPIFGAFYTWEEAQKACPDGWELPSDADFVKLIKAAGGPVDLMPMEESTSGAGGLMCLAYFNGDKMWEYYRGVNITDKTHFSAIPCGYAIRSNDGWDFRGYSEYAVFWTSDEYQGQGVYRSIYKENDNVYIGTAGKTDFAGSVRCIKK